MFSDRYVVDFVGCCVKTDMDILSVAKNVARDSSGGLPGEGASNKN